MPTGLKVFLHSLVFGAAGGYLAFRIVYWVALRFATGEYREAIALAAAALSALLVGVSSAVTAGVLAGRHRRSATTSS